MGYPRPDYLSPNPNLLCCLSGFSICSDSAKKKFFTASLLGQLFSDMVRVVDCHAGVLGSNPEGPKIFSLWNYFILLDPSAGFLIIVLGSLGDLIPEGRSNAYATPMRPRDI